MAHRNMHTKEFIVGAAVGSLLGSVAALLTSPTTGRKLREDICDAYCNLTDRTHDLADRGKSLAKSISCQTCDWASRAKSAVNGATKTVKGWVGEEEEEESSRDLIIGGLVGGIVGAALGLMLAPKSGEALRHDIADTYDDISERTHEFADNMTRRGKAFAKTTSSKANKWFALAQNIVNDLSEGANEKGEDLIDHVKGLVNNKRVSEILDWAQLGYRAWHGLQSKKRR
jgi:gas vesicle protein